MDNAGSTSSGGRGFQVRANSDWLIRFESLVGPWALFMPACVRQQHYDPTDLRLGLSFKTLLDKAWLASGWVHGRLVSLHL